MKVETQNDYVVYSKYYDNNILAPGVPLSNTD